MQKEIHQFRNISSIETKMRTIKQHLHVVKEHFTNIVEDVLNITSRTHKRENYH